MPSTSRTKTGKQEKAKQGSAEFINVIQQRQSIYNFLTRVYAKELSEELLLEMSIQMRSLAEVAGITTNKKCRDAIRKLTEFTGSITKHNASGVQEKLAADYARLFLSINTIPPHPSESVYREGSLMQSCRDDVMQLYWSFGVDINTEFTEPEDHIAVELSFMEFLCQKAVVEIKKGAEREAGRIIQTQNDFLDKHLLKWVPKLIDDIIVSAKTSFYSSIAVLTGELLNIDAAICRDIVIKLNTRRIN